MRRFKLIVVSLIAALSVGLAPMSVSAATTPDATTKDNMAKICTDNPGASVCKDWDPSKNPETEVSNTVRNIVNVLLFAIGILAIISIIISGMKFVSSRGDSGAVNKARTQLVYSVVGLVIAASAFAIVNFVIARLGS